MSGQVSPPRKYVGWHELNAVRDEQGRTFSILKDTAGNIGVGLDGGPVDVRKGADPTGVLKGIRMTVGLAEYAPRSVKSVAAGLYMLRKGTEMLATQIRRPDKLDEFAAATTKGLNASIAMAKVGIQTQGLEQTFAPMKALLGIALSDIDWLCRLNARLLLTREACVTLQNGIEKRQDLPLAETNALLDALFHPLDGLARKEVLRAYLAKTGTGLTSGEHGKAIVHIFRELLGSMPQSLKVPSAKRQLIDAAADCEIPNPWGS